MEDNYYIIIRVLKEMQLNYTNQQPELIPDMHLVVKIIKEEIKIR